ncbi:MAG: 3-phosphoserine/phosphohydroxythreonine transaminase [Spirochaetes bacterium]|nr:3-phosphoserine/phosphohydroxythreonine transaminase [Spirochaetota bacterium]
MARVYNFSAGPSVLPEAVLKTAAAELVEYKNTGMSVMEMSHRSAMYEEIINTAEADLRKLMNIPENYKVLFLQGGASSQFAMVPMNLMKNSRKADFVHTGQWSKMAIKEAKRYGTVNIVASSEDKTFNYIPEFDTNRFSADADYFHIVTNNTIYGTKPAKMPETGNVPLVADMSSNILSEPYNVSDFGLIFAGAQKNIGPAGLTIVIIRDDLTDYSMDMTPTMFQYKTHVEGGSMYNTPPTYGIYFAGLTFKWLLEIGGVEEIAKINRQKAALLYDYLDNSALFNATVADRNHRSIMNIPFITGNEDLDKKFVKEAEKNGIVNIKGHRTVGGMRASIYNGMPVEGVKALVEFMKKFETENK